MRLVDVLGAPPTSRAFRTAKVVGHGTGSVSIELAGATVTAKYLDAKPAVGAVVLVAYVADEPVCFGSFGTA